MNPITKLLVLKTRVMAITPMFSAHAGDDFAGADGSLSGAQEPARHGNLAGLK